jgi:hypothetical protein
MSKVTDPRMMMVKSNTEARGDNNIIDIYTG